MHMMGSGDVPRKQGAAGGVYERLSKAIEAKSCVFVSLNGRTLLVAPHILYMSGGEAVLERLRWRLTAAICLIRSLPPIPWLI